MNCFVCQGKLKVTLLGGEFVVKEGSTPNNVNFEKVTKLITLGSSDEEVMLTVNIECASDPSHQIFGTVDSAIRYEIYLRIMSAARNLAQKYAGDY